jgi:hypothetical protein
MLIDRVLGVKKHGVRKVTNVKVFYSSLVLVNPDTIRERLVQASLCCRISLQFLLAPDENLTSGRELKVREVIS